MAQKMKILSIDRNVDPKNIPADSAWLWLFPFYASQKEARNPRQQENDIQRDQHTFVIGNVDKITCCVCGGEFKHDPVRDDDYSNSETKQAAARRGWQFDSTEKKWYCHWCWLHGPALPGTCWSCGLSLSACICKFQPAS